MSVFVKICGICRKADLDAVLAAEPDAVGFVFWPRSPRAVDPETVARWSESVPASVMRVAVLVDPDEAQLRNVLNRCAPDAVQLHRLAASPRDTAERCERVLGASAQAPERWAACTPTEALTDETFRRFDRILLDAFDRARVGGTGRCCDWTAARRAAGELDRPVLLAGGLSPANLTDALAAVRPAGVDVSSGVESAPGEKDPEKVKRFIDLCRTTS